MLTVYVIEIKDSRLKHITAHDHLKQILASSALPENLLERTKRTCCGKLTAGDYYINISYAVKKVLVHIFGFFAPSFFIHFHFYPPNFR